MKEFVMKGGLVAVLGFALLAAGCASHYYRVTDPQSGSVYYTEEVDHLKGGAVKLKDARTGSLVTLQNSEVKEITSQQYEAGRTAPIFKPTPAAAPVTAPTTTPTVAPTIAPAAAPAPATAPAAAPAPTPAEAPSSAPSGTK